MSDAQRVANLKEGYDNYKMRANEQRALLAEVLMARGVDVAGAWVSRDDLIDAGLIRDVESDGEAGESC